MAKVHVLEGDARSVRAVIHYLTPAGNNSASQPWTSVLASLVSKQTSPSVLTEGTGVAQIATAERNEIIAGTTVELVATLDVDGSGGSAAQVLPQITALINAHKAELAAKYKWYGRAEGVVN